MPSKKKSIDLLYYQPFAHRELWNNFLNQAKNAHFLFDRNFMEYHQERFQDASILLFQHSKLCALFPANHVENCVYSHQGLTYGGLILKKNLKTEQVFRLLDALFDFLKRQSIKKVFYKQAPDYQQVVSCGEVAYYFFKKRLFPVSCELSSVIDLQSDFRHLEKKGRIKKTASPQLRCSEETDFSVFWGVLAQYLQEKYKRLPVHSLLEIEQLHQKFPNNIKLYHIAKKNNFLGGAVLFLNPYTKVVHLQYITQTQQGKEEHVLDTLISFLIEKYKDYRYFSFGISNERKTNRINSGLLSWKEKFGGRSFPHYTYQIDL